MITGSSRLTARAVAVGGLLVGLVVGCSPDPELVEAGAGSSTSAPAPPEPEPEPEPEPTGPAPDAEPEPTGPAPDAEPEPDRGEPVDPDQVQGLWLLELLVVDGEPISLEEIWEPRFAEIEGNEFSFGGLCNWIGGAFGGGVGSTAGGCGPMPGVTVHPHRADEAMIAAVHDGPRLAGDRLVFVDGDTVLTYQSITDPTPFEVFAVLADDTRQVSTDGIRLHPEAPDHLDYERLVRVDHPATDAGLYLGVDGELVCFLVSVADTSASSCSQPRGRIRLSRAMDIYDTDGPVGLEVATIPDPFTAAVAARPELGELSENILVVADDAPRGLHLITNDQGDQLRLVLHDRS